MIQLTVALPIYNSKTIAWVAFESLCRQEKVDFKWELLIMEEQIDQFGLEEVEKYADRLREVGCVSVKYLAIDYHIPLPQKWKTLADRRSGSSKVFLLQAADCYAEPLRLRRTMDKVDEGHDWIQNRTGYYYSIHYKMVILFDQKSFGYGCKTGLNMACATSILDRLPGDGFQKSGIDNWFYRMVAPVNPYWIEDCIPNGVDFDGLNNISWERRFYFHNPRAPFLKTETTIEEILPKDLIQQVKNLHIK